MSDSLASSSNSAPEEGPQPHDDLEEAGWPIVEVSRAAGLLDFAEWAFGPRGFS